MRRMKMKSLKLGAILLSQAVISTAFASGGIYYADTTYQNPAEFVFKLDQKQHHQFQISETNLLSSIQFTGISGYTAVYGKSSSHNYNPLFSFAYYGRINPQWIFGLIVGHPLQSKVEFSRTAFTHFAATKSIFQTTNISPSLAYQVNEKVALGAGLDAERVSATLESAVLSATSLFSIKAEDVGFGYHAGVLLHPILGTLIGLSYYSQIHFDNLTGPSTYPGVSPTKIKSRVTLPASVRIKLYQALSPIFGIVARIDYHRWSVLKQLVLKNTALGLVTLPYNLHDTWKYGLGIRYTPALWAISFGGSYDQIPAPRVNKRLSGPEENFFTLGGEVEREFTKNIKGAAGYYHSFIGHVPLNHTASSVTTRGTALVSGDEIEFRLTYTV